MEARTLRLLELDKILAMLRQACATPMGEALASDQKPQPDPDRVADLQAQTAEAVALLNRETPPLSGLADIRPETVRAGKGGVLDPQQLHRVGMFIAASNRLKKHIVRHGIQDGFLWLAAQGLVELAGLARELALAVDNDGNVLDTASAELRSIRRRLESGRGKLRGKLDAMVKSPAIQKHLQEPLVTQRNGRYCLPVKSESRAQVPGVVHDQSASGATLFVEPMAVVEVNNELARLEREEEQEIHRILLHLSGQVGEQRDALLTAVEAAGDLDLMLARGKLAQDMEAVQPEIGAALSIYRGRHPLLPKEDVVPITVRLGDEFNVLVITGPNTGGKTVTLKTIGLFCLMAQCGLWLPAEQCTVPVYSKVFADIGDEQSIEQSLSTFSSHMTNIVSILEQADASSLVLLDELGAGTDPAEGAALATALLDRFRQAGAAVVATTHYSELKEYAWTEPGVQNASVEFDVETLRPTYRLLVGTPGKSNAFEIAKRLGLPAEVVASARRRMHSDSRRMEDMLAALEQKRVEAEKHLEAARQSRQQAQQLKTSYQDRLDKIQLERDKILERARQKANALVEKARSQAEELLEAIRQAGRGGNADDLQRQVREQLKPVPKQQHRPGAGGVAPDAATLKPGQPVQVLSLGQRGIVAAVQGKQVQVQVGIMKVTVDIGDLRLATADKEPTPPRVVAETNIQDVSTQLDLRGMQVEEATAAVDKFLDRALLAGIKSVSLIHGKGTGALGKGLQQWLKNHAAVANFRYGGAGEGGSGVTVVELK